MDDLKPIKAELKKQKERKYLEDKIKEPQTLTIKEEMCATDTDQVTAAFGNFLAHMGEIEVPWHIEEDDKIILHKEEIAEKCASWNKRPDEFESVNFPNEMSGNLENIRQLESDYAAMCESGDFSKAAEVERRFISQLKVLGSADPPHLPYLPPIEEGSIQRTLDELRDDLSDMAWDAITEAPGIQILCHGVCCCRVNCCENPEVVEQDGHFHCDACDDICEEPLV